MNFMFLDAPAYNSDISSWNVARVSNMYFMFAHAAAYNSDLSAWNVANVSDMTSMFGSASSFNSNLADWNVASVSTTNNMFRSAEAFDRNIAGWNVLSVRSLSGASPHLRPLASLLRSHATESRDCWRRSQRRISDVCIRNVPRTEWLLAPRLEWQTSSPTPSA